MKEITITELSKYTDKDRYTWISGQIDNKPNNIITIVDKFENTENTYLVIKDKTT